MICSKCPSPAYCKGVCRPCYMKEYRQKPDQVEKRRKHHLEHYKNCHDVYVRARKKYAEKHRESRRKKLETFVNIFRVRPGYVFYKDATDKARLGSLHQATPTWADKEAIKRFYKDRPPGWHVDHIIPINGKGVCGLHVLENLQYLPAIDNLKKGNKY